jgi:Uma2 family endonuclease
MSGLTIQLQPSKELTAYNLQRWAELLNDPEIARVEGRIETDRYGQIIMSPPASAQHGSFQAAIAFLLKQHLPEGRTLTECPISTADGVKAADVAWASLKSIRLLGNRICFAAAPEICVEILSPRNSSGEMDQKKALYFEAGAIEVWLCGLNGSMSFFQSDPLGQITVSKLCPKFPKRIKP